MSSRGRLVIRPSSTSNGNDTETDKDVNKKGGIVIKANIASSSNAVFIDDDDFINDDDLAELASTEGATTLNEMMSSDNFNVDQLSWRVYYSTDNNPTNGSWALPIMFKMAEKGGQKCKRYWQIGYDEDSNSLVSIYGWVGGKSQRAPIRVESKGNKSNQQQAWQDANKRYTDNWRDNYRPHGEEESSVVKAMLANKYRNPNIDSSCKRVSSIAFPALIDPKIDGIRGMVYLIDGKVKSFSRNSVEQTKFLTAHLSDIAELFAYLPPNVGLDGEWYSSDLSFDRIQGAVQSTKNYNSDIELVQYWIYDVVLPDVGSETRYEILQRAYNNYLTDGGSSNRFVILKKEVVNSHDEILTAFRRYLSEGYEGAMIRHRKDSAKNKTQNRLSTYRPGRYNNLLKVKSFIEDEFTIVGVEQGRGKHEGKVVFILQTGQGKSFTCVPAATHEQREVWFQNPKECIGRLYTVKFFEWTKDNVPRFPIGKAFRDNASNPGTKAY